MLVCFLVLSTYSQNDGANNNPNSLEGVPFGQRLYVGGDLGLSFGNFTFVNVSPIVGYRINKKWSAGIGAKYIYLRESYPQYNWEYSSSIYGGSLFSRYLIGENFLVHAEWERLNTEVWELFANQASRRWVDMAFLGAGYRQGLGGTYIQLLVLYDLINDRYSPYRGQYISSDLPIIFRGGIVIGLGN